MAVRSDVVRNRKRVLSAAAAMRLRGQSLQLNAVAREAGVGVGTVYRHFADADELIEALVHDRFAELEVRAGEITDEASLRTFLSGALDLLVADADFAAIATKPEPALAATSAARASLVAVLSDAIARTQAGSKTVGRLGPSDILALLCGLAYAIRRSGATDEKAQLYLDAFFRGVLFARAE